MKSAWLFWTLYAAGAVAAAHAADDSALLPGMVNPGYHEPPAWFKNSFLDMREDVREAAHTGRRVMLYFYQDGCPYCKKLLQDNFGQRRIADTAQRYFDVIAVNLWGDREVTDLRGRETSEKRFAADFKVMFTPTLLFLDERGRVILRINGYYPPEKFLAALEYVGLRQEAALSFRDYGAKRAPAPATGRLHQDRAYLSAPYRLGGSSRRAGRPLLVLFEQKQCAPCDELHLDIFARRDTQELLRRFDVALLDMWSDTPVELPTGQATTARDWAKSLALSYAPTLVFFDSAGKEVFRADAYLRAFHVQSALDYIVSGAYQREPSFQRYVATRAQRLRAQGIPIELMQ